MKTLFLVCTVAFLGFVSALVASWINYQDLIASLVTALGFSFVAGLVAVFVFVGVEIAERKGYSGGFAFIALLIFHVFALVIILVLPSRIRTSS